MTISVLDTSNIFISSGRSIGTLSVWLVVVPIPHILVAICKFDSSFSIFFAFVVFSKILISISINYRTLSMMFISLKLTNVFITIVIGECAKTFILWIFGLMSVFWTKRQIRCKRHLKTSQKCHNQETNF